MRKRLKERDQEINSLKETVAKLQLLVEFVNSFDAPENLKRILDFLKDGLTDSMYEPFKVLIEENLEMHTKEDY